MSAAIGRGLTSAFAAAGWGLALVFGAAYVSDTAQPEPRSDVASEPVPRESAIADVGVPDSTSPSVAATSTTPAPLPTASPADANESDTSRTILLPRTPSKIVFASYKASVDKRRAVFDQSFEGRLYQLARRMEMDLRVDWESIHSPWHRTLVGLAPSLSEPAIDGVRTLLEKNPGWLDYAVLTDPQGDKTLLITTPEVVKALGPKPTLDAALALRPFGGIRHIVRPETSMYLLVEALRQPIEAEPRELKLVAALNEVAMQSGLAMKIDVDEFAADWISPQERIWFAPKGREARAVLYDVLRQADADQTGRLVYCYEKTATGDFRLLITTRAAALRDRRTLPSDMSEEPDDI